MWNEHLASKTDKFTNHLSKHWDKINHDFYVSAFRIECRTCGWFHVSHRTLGVLLHNLALHYSPTNPYGHDRHQSALSFQADESRLEVERTQQRTREQNAEPYSPPTTDTQPGPTEVT